MPEYEKETTEQQRLEKEQLEDLGTVWRTRGPHAIHCLIVSGQIEGHVEAPQGQKTTKYEHVIPQLVAVQEDPAVEGLLVLINTVGGDVEAGLALAELIASISKPSATVVLGGGHSIGIPLAVSARPRLSPISGALASPPCFHTASITSSSDSGSRQNSGMMIPSFFYILHLQKISVNKIFANAEKRKSAPTMGCRTWGRKPYLQILKNLQNRILLAPVFRDNKKQD